MDSLTGILPVAKGGTGNSVAGNTTLENLGLLVKDTTQIGVNLQQVNETLDYSQFARTYNSIQEAISSLPKRLNSTVTIYIGPGTYTENLTITGFYGPGSLIIYNELSEQRAISDANAESISRKDVIIRGKISISNCTSYIRIGGNFAPSSDHTTLKIPYFRVFGTEQSIIDANGDIELITATNCTRVMIANLLCHGDLTSLIGAVKSTPTTAGAHSGVSATHQSRVYVSACSFWAFEYPLKATYGGYLYAANIVGGNADGNAINTSNSHQNNYRGYAGYGGQLYIGTPTTSKNKIYGSVKKTVKTSIATNVNASSFTVATSF